MLLIFVPLIVVQIVSVVVFFDGSWSRMGRRLSDNLVENIKVIISLKDEGMSVAKIKNTVAHDMGIEFNFYEGKSISSFSRRMKLNPMVVGYLKESMQNVFVDNKYNNIQYIKLDSISGFFDVQYVTSLL